MKVAELMLTLGVSTAVGSWRTQLRMEILILASGIYGVTIDCVLMFGGVCSEDELPIRFMD